MKENNLKNESLILLVSAESTKWLYGSVLLKYFNSEFELKKNIKEKLNFFDSIYFSIHFSIISSLISIKKKLKNIPIFGKYF